MSTALVLLCERTATPKAARIRLSPQAAAMLAGVGFYGGELSGLVVLRVPPGEAVLDHFEVDEPLAQVDAAHLAMIPVYTDGRTSRQAAALNSAAISIAADQPYPVTGTSRNHR